MKKSIKNKKRSLSAKVFPYNVTFDALDKYEGDENATLRDTLKELYVMSKASPKKAIKKLRIAIRRYPQVPEFFNYLYIATNLAYGLEESHKVTLEALKRFPDYFFAKLGLAEYYIYKGDLEKIPAIFDNKFDLKQLLPGREVFHISEVTGFLSVLILYYTRLNNFGAAEKYFSQLESVDPENPVLEELEEVVFEMRLEAKISQALV